MLFPNLYGLDDKLDQELDKVNHVATYAMTIALIFAGVCYIGTTLLS